MEATLLPPVATEHTTEDRASNRHLDEVGVNAVLDAMREQKARRSSFPAAAEIELPDEAPGAIDADATSEIPRRRRVPQNSDAFLKAR